MSILTVTDVTHGFGARCILDHASFRLLRGEHIGLVGANGEGKSVFLNIITGKISPDSGTIEWCKRITTGYLDQFSTLAAGKTIRDVLQDAFAPMYELEREMLASYERMSEVSEDEMTPLLEDVGDIQETLEHSGFYSTDVKISEIANGLGLAEIGLERQVTELSGGQRAKVLLAKLLLENPMILILDEPTNFLDENHVAWLKQFLMDYENAFILVSHDTDFMNSVVNIIYHTEHATLTRYVGNYEQFLKLHELKQQQLEQAFVKQQKEIDHLEEFVAKNKARAATSNMAKSRQKKLDKMDIIKIAPQALVPKFSFTYSRAPGKAVIVADSLILGYTEPLTRPISFV
ncbi:MAG: ATP-binding cassette domain-containing protein, partial [Angelakisella sp.]